MLKTAHSLAHRRHAIAAALLLALALIPAGRSANAQERLERQRQKNGAAVLKVFRPVVKTARLATVRVRSGDEDRALGVVVDSTGYILTKKSELQEPVVCRLFDGRKLEAEIIGTDPELDLAMLRVEAEGLPVVEWDTDSDDPTVGSWLATPGPKANPVGVGVVSVKRRRIAPERGVLGIAITDDEQGPRITKVFPNSGASEAGLEVDDVITRVSGQAVETGQALTRLLRSFRPGDSLKLLIQRGKEEKRVRARLGHPFSSLLSRQGFQNRIGGDLSKRRAGFPAVLQHDTVLRPEDCGGVVVDLEGRAIGLNIARAGRVATYALPAELVLGKIDALKSGMVAGAEKSAAVLPEGRTAAAGR